MSLDLYKFIPPCIKMASKNLIKSEIYTPALHMKFAYDLLMHFAPELSDSDFLEVYKNYASNDSENIELYNNISTKEPFKILNEIKQLHTTQLFRTKPSTCSSILSDYKMDKCGCCQLCKYSKEYVNSLKDNEYIILSYACASGDIRILSVQNKLELFRYSIPVIKDDNTMCVFPISRLFLDSYLSNYSSNHSQLQTTVNDGVQFEIFYKYLQKKGLKFSDAGLCIIRDEIQNILLNADTIPYETYVKSLSLIQKPYTYKPEIVDGINRRSKRKTTQSKNQIQNKLVETTDHNDGMSETTSQLISRFTESIIDHMYEEKDNNNIQVSKIQPESDIELLEVKSNENAVIPPPDSNNDIKADITPAANSTPSITEEYTPTVAAESGKADITIDFDLPFGEAETFIPTDKSEVSLPQYDNDKLVPGNPASNINPIETEPIFNTIDNTQTDEASASMLCKDNHHIIFPKTSEELTAFLESYLISPYEVYYLFEQDPGFIKLINMVETENDISKCISNILHDSSGAFITEYAIICDKEGILIQCDGAYWFIDDNARAAFFWLFTARKQVLKITSNILALANYLSRHQISCYNVYSLPVMYSQLYPDQERILLSSLFDKYLKKKKNLFQHIFCNYRRLFAELKSKINNENLVKSYSSINNVFLGLSSGYLITDISNAKEPLYDVWNNSLIKNNYSNNITFLEGYSIIKISLDIKHSKTRDCIDTALIFRKVIGKAYETGICKLFSLRPLSLNSDSLLFCCMKKDAYNLIDIISHLSKKSYHQVCKDYTIPLFQVELVND